MRRSDVPKLQPAIIDDDIGNRKPRERDVANGSCGHLRSAVAGGRLIDLLDR
jgi:hypothetical protein